MADDHQPRRGAAIRAFEQQAKAALAAEGHGHDLHLRAALALLAMNQLAAIVRRDVVGLLDRCRGRHGDDGVVLQRIATGIQVNGERKLFANRDPGLLARTRAQVLFGVGSMRTRSLRSMRAIEPAPSSMVEGPRRV